MDNEIVTTILSVFAAVSSAGIAGVTAAFRKQLAPLRGRRDMRVCLVCDPKLAEACSAFRTQLRAAGYQHVSMTHSPAAASADTVVLWKPAKDTAAKVVADLRLASPLAYLLVFTQDRLEVSIDDRSLLSNSRLRLLSDLGVVSEAHAAEADK